MNRIRDRLRRSRRLTVVERALVAVTAALACGTIALSAASAAGAGTAGTLPTDGPYEQGPLNAVSHAETAPQGIRPLSLSPFSADN